MNNETDMDNLLLQDANDGRTIVVSDHATEVQIDSPAVLDQVQVRNLRDFLTEWLGDSHPHPSVALEAHAAVYGDREDDYGHPREDFTRTAIIWTGLLSHKLAEGAYIEAEDIARCQIGVKLARDVHAGKRDNRVDIAGYAITLDRLETGR